MDLIDDEEQTTLPLSGVQNNVDILDELNKLGFYVIRSCSGLNEDNESGEQPWTPFVTIDVEDPLSYYHIFTVADMAGWDANYGVNGLGIELQLHEATQEEIRIRWDLLLDSARVVIRRIQILGKGNRLE